MNKLSTTTEKIELSSYISKWNSEEVSGMLSQLGLGYLAKSFISQNINGYDLCYLNHDILKNELKIVSFHERNLLLKGISEHQLNQSK